MFHYVLLKMAQIWVSSAHSASGYFTVYGDESSTEDHFDAHLATGDIRTQYCRTGYIGFVRRTEMTQSDGGKREYFLTTWVFFVFFPSLRWPL